MDHDNSRVPMSKSEHGARNSDRPLASGVRMVNKRIPLLVDLRKSLRIDMALQIDLIAWDMKGKGRQELFRRKEKMRANKEVLEYVLHH
ncbi:hypothetical protein NC651_005543 [Populus alba x Populus x berolinensis]|nr:hypothetical protein NC651_005543 [Populus alba x Populus x berolinensis]